ncbi:MAG: type I pullulanase, partial [Chthoniobacterales bacterium]
MLPASTGAAEETKKWHDIPVSKPDNRITIHYHRADKSYDGVNLWTWDGDGKKTPKQNWIDPIGEDDFGAVFQIDRASYGESSKIGLIPRAGTDWSQKDGGDKFWTPPLGREIWLVSRKDKVFAKLPDLSPHLEGAYLDSPDRVVLVLSDPAPSLPAVSIFNEKDESLAATLPGDDSAALELTATPAEPLDITQHQYRVQVDGFGAPVPLTARAILDDRDLFYDADAKLGASCTEDATTFRIFAPTAKAVSLALYDNATGEKGRHVEPLARESKGLWSTTVKGDLRGKFYTYLLEGPGLNPEHEILDPYATNSVASSTRGRLTPLPAPAAGGPKVESPTDLVIYEMHVRDFTIDPNSGVQPRGLYLGWTESGTHLPSDPALKTALDHLSELGVTHVQLMPVQDFENDESRRDYNWGYITSDFFSPEGLFATQPNDDSRVREFKALVEALHARGIGVIMDVVFNHTSGKAPFFAIAPDYYYRHLPDGSLAAGSGVGNEFRSEAPMVRKLIIDSLKYWVTEYGIDGFRFDLMALIDQETMHEADRALREINPDIVLFGEPWTGGDSPLVEKTDKDAMRQMEPIGAFNDDFRNALKGSPDGNDPGWIENGAHADALKDALRVTAWFASPAQSINYMTCHDNLVLWDKLKAAMPEASEPTLEATAKLGYLALLTAQGVPFFQGGEEFARSKGGNNNSYDSPDAVNQVDWSLKKKHLAMFRYVRDLIALRKAHPLFRLRTRAEVEERVKFADAPSEKLLVFTIDGDGVPGETWKSACVVLNSDSNAVSVTLPDGNWSMALDERSPSTGSA